MLTKQSLGNVFNIELEKGASKYSGDYLYRSGSMKWDIESGMWGILRVVDSSKEIPEDECVLDSWIDGIKKMV